MVQVVGGRLSLLGGLQQGEKGGRLLLPRRQAQPRLISLDLGETKCLSVIQGRDGIQGRLPAPLPKPPLARPRRLVKLNNLIGIVYLSPVGFVQMRPL
ncbi:hypothetical protein MTP99_000313 [Tenebrio molitor]|jgi:hypothetical protein|nr:hypothetical protein MTP99_000313 [Tenebrio molitor]